MEKQLLLEEIYVRVLIWKKEISCTLGVSSNLTVSFNPWECPGVLIGFLWEPGKGLVGVLWGSQVLAGNPEGFLWDYHGAFQIPERPIQIIPLTFLMITTKLISLST